MRVVLTNRLASVAAATLLAALLALPAGAALPRAPNTLAELIDPQLPSGLITPAPAIAGTSLLTAPAPSTAAARLRLHLASPPSWPYPPARAWAFEAAGAKNRVWGFELGRSEQRQENQWFIRRIAVGAHYARFYDPMLGRFLSHDPVDGDLTNPPSLHRYLYAFQNPTVFVDPDGRMPDEAQEEIKTLSDLVTAEGVSHDPGKEVPDGFTVVKVFADGTPVIVPTTRLEELGIPAPELGGAGDGPSFFEQKAQSLKDLGKKVASFFTDPLKEKAQAFSDAVDEGTSNRKDSSLDSLAQGDQERLNQAKIAAEAAGRLGVEAVNTGSSVAGAAGGGKLIIGAAREAAERQAKKRAARAAGRAAAGGADEAAVGTRGAAQGGEFGRDVGNAVGRIETPQGRRLTEHATESLERHGFKSLDEVDDIVDNATHLISQRDGAIVHVVRTGRGGKASFSYIVEGEDGVVTGLRNQTKQQLRQIARNQGWESLPF